MTKLDSSAQPACPGLQARYDLADTGNLVDLETELKRTCASAKHSLAYNEEWFVDDSCQCAHGQGCPISKYRCIPCTVLSRGGNLKRDGPLREGKRHYRAIRSPMGHPRLSEEFARELRAYCLLEKVCEVPEYYGSFYCGGRAIHLMKKLSCLDTALAIEADKLAVQLSILLRKLHSLGFELASVCGAQLELLKLNRCITVAGAKVNFDFGLMMPRVDGLVLAGERICDWSDHDYLRTLSIKQVIQYHTRRLILELAQRPGLILRDKTWAHFWGSQLATAVGCLRHKLRLPVQVMVIASDQA